MKIQCTELCVMISTCSGATHAGKSGRFAAAVRDFVHERRMHVPLSVRAHHAALAERLLR